MLIVDVGAHDGTDTRNYLDQGYKVVSIEADPMKAEALREMFARQIEEGQCVVVQCGVSNRPGTMPFYRCSRDGGSSSFRPEFAGPSPEVIEVPVRSLLSVLEPFERPHYIKCDIEGYDYEALSALTPTHAPDYISGEIQDRPELLDLFLSLGYTRFKLIAQPYGTSSEEIYDHEYGWRALRKLSRVVPGLSGVLRAMPQRWRPKTEWDAEEDTSSSGPFGEEAFGPWLDEAAARAKLDRIMRHVRSAPIGRAWVDLHAGARREATD